MKIKHDIALALDFPLSNNNKKRITREIFECSFLQPRTSFTMTKCEREQNCKV